MLSQCITVNFSFNNPTTNIHIIGMFESNVPVARNQINVRLLWILVPVFPVLAAFALKTLVFSCFYCKFVIQSGLVIHWASDLITKSSVAC